MGVLSARNAATMSPAKPPADIGRASGIARRDIRASYDGNYEGEPISRVSDASMPHRGESTAFRRGTCGNTRIRLQRHEGRDPEAERELAVGRP